MMFDPYEFVQSSNFKHNVDEPNLVRNIYLAADLEQEAPVLETFIID